MQVSDAINEMFRISNVSKYFASKKLGHENNYITVTINSKRDLRASTIAQIADCCNYSLTLVPNDDLTDSHIVISG